MSLYISREALKATSIYFIYYTIWSIIDSHGYIKTYTVFSKNMVTHRLMYLMLYTSCMVMSWAEKIERANSVVIYCFYIYSKT